MEQYDIEEFLNVDFKTSKYFPVEENIEDKSDEVKEAWRSIFSFAYEINRNGRKFTETDVKNLTEQFCGIIHGLTIAKVERVFKKVFELNKDEFGIVNKPDIVKVEVWLKKNWDFAFNEVTQTTEFKKKTANAWDEVNIDTIFRRLQIVGFKFGLDKLKSLLKSDFIPRYNPFADYFEGLEKWDGIDYIEQLASFVSVADKDFFVQQFRKTLVRCIGCSLYGRENRIVFTLVGEKQNTGKSTFIRFINPFGTSKYYTEAPLRNNKDTEFSFAENFIYNLEELASLSNTDVNRLKSIISTASIKERKAYAVNATNQPRRCNFFGSTNKNEFLTDTENTRWLCFDVLGIDWGYKKDIDINKVWAQAYYLYHNGFNDQLTADEAAIRDKKNKDYEINDLEKELIKKAFKTCWKGEGNFYTAADIFNVIVEMTKGKVESRFINKNMKQLEFTPDVKKINGKAARGYWAIYIAPEDRGEYENVTSERTPF